MVELNPSQDVRPMENDWPEEELDISNRQLISILNSCVLVYHKVNSNRPRGETSNYIKKIQKCMSFM